MPEKKKKDRPERQTSHGESFSHDAQECQGKGGWRDVQVQETRGCQEANGSKKSQMSQRSKGQQGLGYGDKIWVNGRLQET